MSEKLVILCIPLSGLGHINATVGIGEALQKRGHKVVLAIERSWKGYFVKSGFEEIVYDEREKQDDVDAGRFWNDLFEEICPYFRGDYEFNTNITKMSFKAFIDIAKYCSEKIKQIIDDLKPDVILQDNYIAYPSIVKSRVPYIILWSSNPLIGICSPNLPPIDSAEPINDSSNWKKLTEIRAKALSEIWEDFNSWLKSEGLPELKKGQFQYDFNHLNVAMYPKMLFDDYAKRVDLKNNWMLLEHCVRSTQNEFKLPDQFKMRPGKLVYFSLGSIATSDINLMKKMIAILSKSKHKFIIALGPKISLEDLAENMWGQRLVPQMEVLKLADAIITHGGNNTVIEALYFGVPLIVTPLFMDQHSNAQRIVEMKFGLKLNPFTVTDEEFLKSIELVLNDDDLRKRLSMVSDQLKNSNSMDEIVERIEQIGKSK